MKTITRYFVWLPVALACLAIAACGGGSGSNGNTGPTTPTVTVTPASSSITTAQSLMVTISVSGSGGTATGSIVLSSGSYTSASTALVSGSAPITIPAGSLAAGTDTLSAAYTSTSPAYSSTSGTGSVTVTAPALLTPTVTVTPAVSSITTAQSLSVTISVSGSGSIPTGAIVLSSGSYTSASTALVSGSAPITIPAGSLTTGSDTLKATYTPDSSSSSTYNSASGTGPVTVIALITPTVTVTPAVSSITTAQSLSVTISVSGSGSVPTGSVVLSSGSYTSASTTLTSGASAGSASITISAGSLATGSDTLKATYTPDSSSSSTYNSASGTSPVTVNALVTITVNPSVTQAISPYIYGIDGNTNASIPNVPEVTIFRMGGNRWTAYNWTTNASNAGNDYLYESDNFLSSSSVPGYAVYPSINTNIAAGEATLFTIPIQGLVSADESGPVPTTSAPDLARFQDVVFQKSSITSTAFTTTPPITVVGGEDTGNVYDDEFVWAMNQLSTTQELFNGTTATPAFVDLDNEPDIWNSTHLEVQGSTEITPAAYIAKTISVAEALKTTFPNIKIFGPSHYGFEGFYSWQGGVTGVTPTGANWFTDSYLQALSTASTTFGKPLVDAYDIHWYPEEYDAGGTRVTSMTAATLSDADMQLVVQTPRTLWDTTYNDSGNSNPWVYQSLGSTPINMLGRLQTKINAEFPSIKLSVSEYETGGFNNIAGTVAQADQLGVFASNDVFAAMLWPPSGTYDYELAGFRAYRNFDGAGSNFGDTSVQTTSSNPGSVMVYVSTDSTTPGRVVMVAINRANTTQVAAISGLSLSGTASLYQITATTASGQSPVKPVSIGTMAVSGSSLSLTLPAYSVTTIEIP